MSDEIDKLIAEGTRIEYAPQDGIGCGRLLLIAAVAFICFVLVPMLGQ